MQRVETEEPEQYALFDLGPNMKQLRAASIALKQSTRAPKTLISYASDWRSFETWCRETGRSSLPASPETVALYVTAKLQNGLKCSSMDRHVAAIAWQHRQAKQAMPDRAEVREVLNGARRQRKEQPRRRAALMPDHLRKICRALLKDRSNRAMRDRAVLVLGFAAGLRRSSLAALDLADVKVEGRKGVIVMLRSSKTDQLGAGKTLGIRRGRKEETCPVRALKDWLKLRGLEPGPLFWPVMNPGDRLLPKRLDPETINDLVKRTCRSVGLNADFGAHSLRAGCVTTAHINGASDLSIMERTGHKSLAMVRAYLRNTDPFAGPDPLANAL